MGGEVEAPADGAVPRAPRQCAFPLGAGQKERPNIPKNRCRTTIAERMAETRAELPFIGDQVVCLSHDQAARSGPRKEAPVFDARRAPSTSMRSLAQALRP